MRASRRPKTSCTTLRATWVATTRSVGAWKVPTLSAREWRSAVLATLGANGSCTWQRSRAARSKRSEIVRATSIGSAARRRPGSGGSASPTARTRASPGDGSSAPVRTALRESRTSVREDDGATTSTRCPRAASSSETRATNVLTSWRSSHGYGVTWAMDSGSGTARRINVRGARPCLDASQRRRSRLSTHWSPCAYSISRPPGVVGAQGEAIGDGARLARARRQADDHAAAGCGLTLQPGDAVADRDAAQVGSAPHRRRAVVADHAQPDRRRHRLARGVEHAQRDRVGPVAQAARVDPRAERRVVVTVQQGVVEPELDVVDPAIVGDRRRQQQRLPDGGAVRRSVQRNRGRRVGGRRRLAGILVGRDRPRLGGGRGVGVARRVAARTVNVCAPVLRPL